MKMVRVESEVFVGVGRFIVNIPTPIDSLLKMGGLLFLFLKRVRIWRKMAAKREQYGHNGGKFVQDVNNRKKKYKFIHAAFLVKLSFSDPFQSKMLSGLYNSVQIISMEFL